MVEVQRLGIIGVELVKKEKRREGNGKVDDLRSFLRLSFQFLNSLIE